jgi:hypothetical protein
MDGSRRVPRCAARRSRSTSRRRLSGRSNATRATTAGPAAARRLQPRSRCSTPRSSDRSLRAADLPRSRTHRPVWRAARLAAVRYLDKRVGRSSCGQRRAPRVCADRSPRPGDQALTLKQTALGAGCANQIAVSRVACIPTGELRDLADAVDRISEGCGWTAPDVDSDIANHHDALANLAASIGTPAARGDPRRPSPRWPRTAFWVGVVLEQLR